MGGYGLRPLEISHCSQTEVPNTPEGTSSPPVGMYWGMTDLAPFLYFSYLSVTISRSKKCYRSKAGWGCLPGKQQWQITLKDKSLLSLLGHEEYRPWARQTDMACILSLLYLQCDLVQLSLLCQSSVSHLLNGYINSYSTELLWLLNEILLLNNTDKHRCFSNANFPFWLFNFSICLRFYNKTRRVWAPKAESVVVTS